MSTLHFTVPWEAQQDFTGCLVGSLDFLPQKRVVAENSAGRLSSDADLLVDREFDQKRRFSESIAACFNQEPRPRTLLALDGSATDFWNPGGLGRSTRPRHEPIFQLVSDRVPADGEVTAGQPTLSRFENAITITTLNAGEKQRLFMTIPYQADG